MNTENTEIPSDLIEILDSIATRLACAWRAERFPVPPAYVSGDRSQFDSPALSESQWAAAVVLLGEKHNLDDIAGTVSVNRDAFGIMRADGMTISDAVHWIIDHPCPCCVAEGRR